MSNEDFVVPEPMIISGRETVATYTLQVIGPGPIKGHEREGDDFVEYEGLRPSLVRETEENLTDLLPEGYSVVIREWDSPGPGYEPAGMHWMRDRKEE